jgi:hypothetical protein
MLLKDQRQQKLIKASRRGLRQGDVHARIRRHERNRMRPGLLKLARERSQLESEWVIKRGIHPTAAKRLHAHDIQADRSLDVASIKVHLSAHAW